MRTRSPIVWLLLGLGCFACLPMASARDVITREAGYFVIAGEHSASVSFAAEMAALVEPLMGRYFSLPERFPQPIVVALVPDWTDAADRLEVSAGDRGAVRVRLAWDRSTRLEELSRALGESFLRRLAFFEGGQSGYDAVPEWLIDALVHRLILAARPRMAGLWSTNLLARDPVAPQFFWSGSGDDPPINPLDAFGLLLVLEEAFASRTEQRFFFERVLLGLDVGPGFRRHLSKFGKHMRVRAEASETEIYLEDYWIMRWWEETWERRLKMFLPRLESLAESEAALDALLRFPSDAGGRTTTLGTLWEKREDPEMVEKIDARLVLLAGRMERMNPAYFNAARSLALLYQGLLRDQPRHRYLRDLSNTLTDLEDARRLRRDIEAAINESLPD